MSKEKQMDLPDNFRKALMDKFIDLCREKYDKQNYDDNDITRGIRKEIKNEYKIYMDSDC